MTEVNVPSDLATKAQRIAYRRGWRDRSRMAGARTSAAKALSSAANGAKGGRPPVPRKVCIIHDDASYDIFTVQGDGLNSFDTKREALAWCKSRGHTVVDVPTGPDGRFQPQV